MHDSKLQIMVCMDLSPSSTLALSHAVTLAKRLDARLHLCHIAKAVSLVAATSLGLNVPDEFPVAQRARVSLQHELAALGADVDGQVHVRMGRPVEEILNLINEIKPDMVVLCSHGKSLFQRALLGSVSRRLVVVSPVPVLIVPAPGHELRRNQPEPIPPPELPSVGHAVGQQESGGATGVGISSVGGAGIRYS